MDWYTMLGAAVGSFLANIVVGFAMKSKLAKIEARCVENHGQFAQNR